MGPELAWNTRGGHLRLISDLCAEPDSKGTQAIRRHRLHGNSTDTQVTIHTKGFAVSPYFSSTIDSITGRNLDKGIVDLPPWEAPTKYSSAMKAYIALSRVRKADDILIAHIMSPTLFSCGAHPWPTRLLQVLRRERERPDSMECKTLEQQNRTSFNPTWLFM